MTNLLLIVVLATLMGILWELRDIHKLLKDNIKDK